MSRCALASRTKQSSVKKEELLEASPKIADSSVSLSHSPLGSSPEPPRSMEFLFEAKPETKAPVAAPTSKAVSIQIAPLHSKLATERSPIDTSATAAKRERDEEKYSQS